MGDQMQGCRGKAGIWAGITGLIVAVFLMVVAHEPFYVAVFMGLLTVLLFGGFLIWAFCTGRDVPEAARPSSAPAKEPVIPESPVETFNAQSPEGAAAHAQAAAAVPVSEPATPAQPAPAPEPAAAPAAAEAPQVEVKAEAAKPAPVEETAPKAAAPAVGQPAAAEGPGKKPRGLKAPRKAGADDLKKIEGIGPKLEETLNGWGIYHFDQIAKWGPEEVAYADQNVPRFKGRCTRDKWVSQARIIVEDGMDAFLERAKTNDY